MLQLGPWIPVIYWMSIVILVPASLTIGSLLIYQKLAGNRVAFVTLKLDNSASIKKCKTKGNKVLVKRGWKPKFTPKAVFPIKKRFMLVFQRTFRYIFCIENEEQCLELNKETGTVMGTAWNIKELTDYIAKVVHLSAVKDRAFSKMEIYFLVALMLAILLMNVLMLRRIGI